LRPDCETPLESLLATFRFSKENNTIETLPGLVSFILQIALRRNALLLCVEITVFTTIAFDKA
jgi:hypothetical protein